MQRPEERESETTATAKATENTTLLDSNVEKDDDFEILSTEILEEETTEMSEKTAKQRGGVMKVKAVLQREGQGVEGSNPEIRRFSVSEANFKALVTSVRSVFNIDPELHCSLFWKDDDGDLIQFSTTQELRHALDSMPDETLRIHVTVTPDVTKVTKEAEGEKEKAGSTATNEATVETPAQGSTSLYPPLPTETSSAPDMPCDRKNQKAKKMAANKQKNEEFNEVRQQVPEKFRRWVRNYVRTWFQQGAEAANQIDTLPEGAPPHFRQWLHDFLSHWTQRHAGIDADGETGMESGEKVEGLVEQDLLSAPEGLPPLYYRWICLFMPRFCQRFTKMKTALPEDKEGDKIPQCPEGHDRRHGHGGRQGKGHHGCHGKKGGKRDGQSSSSESEDSDSGEKMWKKVPKEFRKYVRVSVKQLHKNKGDNPKAKEKATRAGLSPEVLEFVEQILLEWHAKLSHKRPRDVAMEMMEGERSLPAGLERDHFLWLCRFMARWHRRHAGKCDVMSGWSSGETDDTSSGEEGQRGCSHHGRHFRPPVGAGPCPMMHHGCPPPPPPPHQFGCMTPPPPPPFACPRRMKFTARKMGFGVMAQGQMVGCGAARGCRRGQGQGQGCPRWMTQDGGAFASATAPHDVMVERVTDGVKNM